MGWRRRHLLRGIQAALVAALATGAWFALAPPVAPRTPALPPLPELDAWPPEFRQRLATTTKAARAASDAVAPLGELARLYLANGFVAEAEQLLQTLRERDPQEARWPYYLADLRETGGTPEEVRGLLEATLALAPDYAPAQLRLGELLFKNSDHEPAAYWFGRRLEQLPDDPHAGLGLTRIAQLRGDDKDAIARLQRIVATSPDFSAAHALLAAHAEHIGDATQAARHRRAAEAPGRSRNPPDPWLEELNERCFDPYRLQVIGSRYEQTGQLRKAVAYFEKAVRLDPRDPSAYHELTATLLQLGQPDRARAIAAAGLAVEPDFVPLLLTLGTALRQLRRPAEAVQLLQQAIARQPEVADLHNHLGISQERTGRRDAAIAAYRQAIVLDPRHFEAHLNLGKALIAAGEAEAGETVVEQALVLKPDDFDALVFLGGREIDAGDLASAGARLDVLEHQHGDRTAIRQLRAFWHLRRGSDAAREGRTDDAFREFRAGIAADATVADLHGNLGVLQARTGNFTAAIAAFRDFAAAAPDDPMAYLYLGQALLQTSSPSEAREQLEAGRVVARKVGRHDLESRFQHLLERITP